MASIQRMIKSGIRLYNYKPRSINLAAFPIINRAGTPVNLYRSLCSNSCGDRRSILSNIKSSDDADTYTRVIALKAAGIPLQQAQVLAKNWKDLPESRFDSLLKSIQLDRSLEIENAGSTILVALFALGLCGSLVIWGGLGVAMYYNECQYRESQKARERKYNNRGIIG